MSVNELLALHHSETEKVRMVVLEVSVTDRRGRVIDGLDERDFRVYEDEELQQIRHFTSDADEPLSVAFLVDISGSMGMHGRSDRAREAVRSLVAEMGPEDRCALIAFADERARWASQFTRDRGRLLRSLGELENSGQTALVDALAAVPRQVHERVTARKAIVLITDGSDNASRTPLAQVVELARRVNVPVYTIALLSVDVAWLPRGALEARIASLQAVSRVTGGRVYPTYGDEQLGEALASLRDELKTQYVIGYYPEQTQDDSEFQEIRLEVAKRGARARTRSGYYAEP
jgi:VWFA-related protein